MRGVNSQKYFMDHGRLLSCQKRSCPRAVLSYTLDVAGAIKLPEEAAPVNRTWAGAVGLPCLRPQNPVCWRASTRRSSLAPPA